MAMAGDGKVGDSMTKSQEVPMLYMLYTPLHLF